MIKMGWHNNLTGESGEIPDEEADIFLQGSSPNQPARVYMVCKDHGDVRLLDASTLKEVVILVDNIEDLDDKCPTCQKRCGVRMETEPLSTDGQSRLSL
jgi:hypothetical protein